MRTRVVIRRAFFVKLGSVVARGEPQSKASLSRGWILARRPGHLSAAEHVHVQMKDRLAGATSSVDDRAIAAAFRQSVIVGDARTDSQQMAQQRLVLLRSIVERLHVFARNDQQVRWGLRINVADY